MSLEAKIAELTSAVQALTLAMKERVATTYLEKVDAIVETLETPEETRGGLTHEEYQNARLPNASPTLAEVAQAAQVMADAVVVEVPNASPKSGEPSAPVPEQSSPEVTYDDVKRATNNLSAAKGKEVTIAALARFGVKRATELTREQWAPYIDYAGKATSGDVDPLGVA